MKDLGSAHSGISDWYWQRLSAVVLAVLLPLPFFLLIAVYSGSIDQQGLQHIVNHLFSRLLSTILIAALIIHAYIGLKVMIEDYVHVAGLRGILIGLMLVAMFAFSIWWLAIIWGCPLPINHATASRPAVICKARSCSNGFPLQESATQQMAGVQGFCDMIYG